MGGRNLVLFNPVLLEKKEALPNRGRMLVLEEQEVGRPLVMRRFLLALSKDVVEESKKRFVCQAFRSGICRHEMDHLEGIII